MPENTKAFQAEEEEEYEESSEEEYELSLLSRWVNQLWKKRKTKFRGYIRICGRYELTSRQEKSRAYKDVTCFKCKQPGHYKNECPKLLPKNKFFREKKKVMMATWDDSEASKDDSKEEKANIALKASA